MGKLMKGWGVVGRWMERRRMRVPRMMVRMVTRDQVWWRGKVHKVVFSVPLFAPYLTASTQEHFINTVDLSTAELREQSGAQQEA